MTYALLAVVVSLIGGAAYLVYALRDEQKDSRASFAAFITEAKARVETERNLIGVERDRDTQKARADRAEAELADVKAQLVSTQAALVKAQGEAASDAAEKVRTSDDPLAALGSVLASSARSDVPAVGDPGAGNGHQG
jgi:hypothetical protein